MAMLVKIRDDILITSVPDLELFLRLFYSQVKIAKLLANVILLFRQEPTNEFSVTVLEQ